MLKHNPAITYMKAVGIILMVLCHARNVDYFYRFVYMFHMPLFFFVSGFCIKINYLDKPHLYIWRRFKGLYWPFVKWGTLFLLLHNFFLQFNLIGGESYTLQDTMSHVKEIFVSMSYKEPLLAPTWFLPTLLVASVISFIAIYALRYAAKLFNKELKIYFVLLACIFFTIVCVYCSSPFKTFTFLMIGPRVFMSVVFFLIGYYAAQSNIKPFNGGGIIFSATITLIATPFFSIFMVDVFYDTYKIIPYIAVATFATWSIYSLPWDRMSGGLKRALSYIGEHTLPILIFHFMAFKLVSLVIISVHGLPLIRLADTPIIAEYTSYGWWVLYSIVGLGIPLFIHHYYNHLKAYKITKNR